MPVPPESVNELQSCQHCRPPTTRPPYLFHSTDCSSVYPPVNIDFDIDTKSFQSLSLFNWSFSLFLHYFRFKRSVTRVQSRFRDRRFSAAGPRIWNNLPGSLHRIQVSGDSWKHLFQTDCGPSWIFWLLRLINTLIYLLTHLLRVQHAQQYRMNIWSWKHVRRER